MIVDLPAVLARKMFSHPSFLKEARLADESLRLVVNGYSWWTDKPDYSDEPVVMLFSGISEGALDLASMLDSDDDEALGDFNVLPVEDLEWMRPGAFTLYCNQPIPEPLAIYDIVERWVAPACGVREVHDFLHGAERLATFLEYAASQIFLLATGPDSLRALLVRELERQGVQHQLMPSQSQPHGGRYLVRLAGGTWFFCESATLETA